MDDRQLRRESGGEVTGTAVTGEETGRMRTRDICVSGNGIVCMLSKDATTNKRVLGASPLDRR